MNTKFVLFLNRQMGIISILILILMTNWLFVSSIFSQKCANQPVELGSVSWLRDYNTALEKAAQVNKPVLILFQEVPGCATCRNYGTAVLSHPLLVDAIENEFVPLAIFNNKGGEDRKVLDRYNEPTWNNPVIRVVDGSGRDIMERMSGNYTASGLVMQLSLALRTAGEGVPKYLQLLKEELTAAESQSAYYKMFCFWSGESHLGAEQGVLSTEPGWMGGAEVVKVVYDKDQLSKKKLDKHAAKAKCQPMKVQKGYNIDKDPQYYLKKSEYKYLPLSAIQKTKINAAIAKNVDPSSLLSPSQKKWLDSNASKKVLYDLPLEDAWRKMTMQL